MSENLLKLQKCQEVSRIKNVRTFSQITKMSGNWDKNVGKFAQITKMSKNW